jgi:hypothetical protein
MPNDSISQNVHIPKREDVESLIKSSDNAKLNRAKFDIELSQKKKLDNYNRSTILKDALTDVLKVGIYAVPLLFILFVISVVTTLFINNDIETLSLWTKQAVSAVFGAIIMYVVEKSNIFDE